jgi:hypothetical protein
MERSDVNSLIMEHVREIDDGEMRQFLSAVLRHEQSIPEGGRFTDEYHELIDEHAGSDEA